MRWRLILGTASQNVLGGLSDAHSQGQDVALGYLYDREYGPNRNVRVDDRTGGLGESVLGVPDWINMVHELFPRRTIERLERDALEWYGLDEMVTNPELLARAQPSQTLLKVVLRTKHLMNQDVLAMARQLVRRVVDELMERLARRVHAPFVGALDRRRRSPLEGANPTYDHDIAGRLVQLGAHVAAMTPGELADWVAEKVR